MNNNLNPNQQNPQYPYGWGGGGGGNPYNQRFIMPPQTYHQQTGWRPVPIPLA